MPKFAIDQKLAQPLVNRLLDAYTPSMEPAAMHSNLTSLQQTEHSSQLAMAWPAKTMHWPHQRVAQPAQPGGLLSSLQQLQRSLNVDHCRGVSFRCARQVFGFENFA